MTAAVSAEPHDLDTAERVVALTRVSRDGLRATRLLREWPLPASLGAEVARAACEALERVLPVASRPTLVLSSAHGELRLAPSDVALEPHPGAQAGAFEIVRGRNGARLIARAGAKVSRNGWVVPPGLAAPLRDGDLIRAGGVAWHARYEPACARPLVEMTVARRTPHPPAQTLACGFTLVPSSERIHVAVDPGTARSLCDVLLGGTGDAAFEATAIGRVEREIVEWLMRRSFHDAAVWVAGDIALTPADASMPETAVWCQAAVRVGQHRGAVWIGATEGAVALLSERLRAQTRATRFGRAGASRIEALVTASIPLGRITTGEAATLEAGDLLVASDARAWLKDGVFGDGYLTVRGAEPAAVRARFATQGNVLLATVGNLASLEGSIAMVGNEPKLGADGVDETTPFDRILDELTVAVTIEIARKRMALGELLAISSGDVVELNAPISAGVTIVVDGVALGRGELVDVEGVLGVRVTGIGGVR